MRFSKTPIQGIVIVEPIVHGDMRGFFMETWRADLCEINGIPTRFVQDNHSRSVCGTLRGLHYQLPNTQGKLVRVIQGEVFDVAVDIRRGSPTFGAWHGEILSAANRLQMYIPEGFAHGFCVLSENAEFEYKCTKLYSPEHEICIRWDDSDLAIKWPVMKPLLSQKDSKASFLKDIPADRLPCYND